MSAVREFLGLPLVQVAMGVIILLFAIRAFSTGGGGIIVGGLLVFVGVRGVRKGFTEWQSEKSSKD
jgi:hypothetical protein